MKKLFLIVVFSYTFIMGLAAEGKKEEIQTMKVIRPVIENMEYLEYGVYQGGEKTSIFRVVTEIGSKVNRVYYQQILLGDFIQEIPEDYHDYGALIVTDSQTGHMKEYHCNWESLIKSNDFTGTTKTDLVIDKTTGEIVYTQVIWDGFEEKSMVFRQSMEENLPVFGLNTLGFDNLRYFDILAGGTAYITIPDMVADPILGSVSVDKEELIETPIGNFDTYKLIFYPGNSFMRRLLGPLGRALIVWVEKGEKQRTIKFFIPGSNQTFILEKAGLWSN